MVCKLRVRMSKLKSFLHRNSDVIWHKVVPVVNLILVGLSIWGNRIFNAGFCMPVVWAAVVQTVSFLNIITFMWLERTRLKGVNALLCGISTGVYAYWCLFLGAWVLLMPVPVWFLLLLVWRNAVHPVTNGVRRWYAAGMLLCVLFAAGCGVAYRMSCRAYQENRVPDGNPMTERIAGMHFLYHTRICIYDGWRPPLHDPALVLGKRLNLGFDPLCGMELEERVALYHSMYPDRSVTAKCACCRESERNGYFSDPLWKTLEFQWAKELSSKEIWQSFSVEYNNELLADFGLPFAYVDSSFNSVVNFETGDTVSSGSKGSRFTKVSRILFEGSEVYMLSCVDDSKGLHWMILQFPAGKGCTVDLATESFMPKDVPYWIAAQLLNTGEAVEVYYPDLNTRDTLCLVRIEMEGE